MFYKRRLAEGKKKKPLSSTSFIYKNQRDELCCLSKLNVEPNSSSRKKGDKKGKKRVEPSEGKTHKRKLVMIKNARPPSPPKRQMTINESLKKPTKVKPISSIRTVETEVSDEEGGLIKLKRGKEASKSGSSSGLSKENAQNFLGGRSDEIIPAILEMLPVEV